MPVTPETEGIIITISAGMLKERGYRNWLVNFLAAMELHERNMCYWMRQGSRPTADNRLLYVYLCVGGKVRFRAYYGGSEEGSTKTFIGGKTISARAWVLLSGPLERPPRGQVFPMKGFRGFRYTEKLF